MIFLIRRIWHWFYYYFDALRVPVHDVNIRSVSLAWELAGIVARPMRKFDDPWYFAAEKARNERP